ncbi:hypothetical protein Lal_00038011 [Lupinus albus]|nr:hypothetical protein Lal_00038011 [Lupinus albus]
MELEVSTSLAVIEMERERKPWPLSFDTSTCCCSRIGEGKWDGGEGNHLCFASIATVTASATAWHCRPYRNRHQREHHRR